MPRLGVLFPTYEPKIRRLPRRRRLTNADILRPGFRLEHQDRLEMFYAPVDWLRPTARIAIVGITPGKDTMRIAYQTTLDGLVAGDGRAKILNTVKSQASFSGFRPLLIEWLNYLHVHQHLGLSSAEALWTREGQRYLHATSAIRYPVLTSGNNYQGSNPSMTRHPILQRYLRDMLVPELASIPDALIVPLGMRVDDALALLIQEERLDPDRCLVGFPHPSGANGSKTAQWAKNRIRLRRKVAAWFKTHPTT